MYDYGHACQATGPEEVTRLFTHVTQCLLLHTLLHAFYDECNHLHSHCYNFDLRFIFDSCLFDLRPHTPFFIFGGRDPIVHFVTGTLLTLLNGANPYVRGNAVSNLQNVVYVALLFDFYPLQ